MLKRWFFVAVILASSSPMGMSWPCSERYKHCYWRTTYHTPCVDDADEKGCSCKLTSAGPDCKRGQTFGCAKSLGMAYDVRKISDEQINASSWLNEQFTPQQGRLNNPIYAWCPHPLDDLPIFQVTFTENLQFFGVDIQGDPMNGNNHPYWIKIFTQEPGKDRQLKYNYILSINGKKNFKHHVRLYSKGNLIEFQVIDYKGDYACMRVEIYGCHQKGEGVRHDLDCFEHLGVKDPAIFPDSSFSASSEKGVEKAKEARLDDEKSWCPEDSDQNPTLRITLPDVNKQIVGIVAQGDDRKGKYVKHLRLHKDGEQSPPSESLYLNYDSVATVLRFIKPRITMKDNDDNPDTANNLELQVEQHGTGDCMKIELIACDLTEPCYSFPCLNGGTCIREKLEQFTCQCHRWFEGNTCERGICMDEIQVDNVNVSSSAGKISYRLANLSSWCATESDGENWIQLTFFSIHHVRAFSLGGNTNTSTLSFVKKFRVFYKLYPWLEWTAITSNKSGDVFNGTLKSGNDRVDYLLDSSTRAFSILFKILDYNDWELKCTRVEVKGCHDSEFCDVYNPCVNGTCLLEERKPFVCSCFPGFEGMFCERDLCKELNCHDNAKCVIGSNVTCECNPGFQGSGQHCEDICQVSKCHHNATCGENTSYQCTCHEDFQGNGTYCEDRCVAANCHADATCNKTTGYACVCNYGYKGNGSQCEDLCGAANCHENATCELQDDIKFANCSCDRGFVGNGTHCVDLCENANCHNNATCFRNDDKTFANCSCNFGFKGDGRHCFDLCKNATCHQNATCNLYDEKKFANCSCNIGFGGDGRHCFDLCEEANCHKKASCVLFDDIKFANCSCAHGFAGNGTYCFDLCEEANCHENGHCVLQDEKKFANCSCNQGYRGNGTFCTAYYEWSAWTTCEKECGVEFYRRARECVTPEAPFCISTETVEEGSCGLEPCAVHGNWTTWGDWATCGVTCGSGIHVRSRDCTNPKPQHGGDECPGVGKEFEDCDVKQLCPGTEGFGIWSNWSECNMTCDEGFQSRSRNCENIALGCLGEKTQIKPCLLKYCPVNGSYTPWSNWTACSTTCGPGQQLRHRNCTQPKPAYGGADCQEPGTEVKECFLESICSADFGFSLWSSWSSCTSTCGNGLHWRARECQMSDPGSYFCSGEKNQTDFCNLRSCPISGGFTNWTDWSECDRQCGSGQQEKTRFCNNPAPQHGGDECSGETRQLQDCTMPDCLGDVNFTPWSNWTACSVSCGSGVQSKTRYCKTADGCEGPAQESKECLLSPCPVNGGFTEWSDWSICSITCGSGTIERRRECSNPKPSNNGSDCFGLKVEVKECTMPTICQDEAGFTVWSLWSVCNEECSNGQIYRTRECLDPTLETCNGTYKQNNTCYAGPCPIHGGYSKWTSWSPCSGYCGSGLQSRRRTCSNPEPAFNGAGCSGSSEQTQDCQHANICSGESGYNQWSQWTLCTQTCGNSTQIRTRSCNEDAPPQGCSQPSTQTKHCDKGQCPVHGNWAEWSVWTPCSSSCGSGSKLRHRSCGNPAPSYGGLSCFGNAEDYVDCTMPSICPGDDEFSQWGNWGECNVTCGEGTRQRSRYCTVVPKYPPREDPYCTLSTEQYIPCYQEPCVVNGNFTPWTDWSACTTSCGFGTRARYRNCTNPPPMFGGGDCLGPLHQMKECENMPDCPDDGFFTSWADWAECSSDCEGVTYKTRTCQMDENEQCTSLTNVTIECNTEACPVDGTWSQWTPWSLCSKTCGHQEEVRTRVCENQRNGGSYCSGHNIEVMPCNDYDYIPCPDPPPAQWSDWSWWDVCSKSCGGGDQKRFRECNDPPPAHGWPSCAGVKNETQNCNTHSCPIDGNWSEWTSWTQCTLECGSGTQVRGRACVNPRAQYGGKECEGDSTEVEHCNVDPCPVHGGFTSWSSWTFCNKPCGNGTSDRQRSCTNPTPMYGGQNCSGESLQWIECNTHPCAPVNVVLDVTFVDVSWQEYSSNMILFKLDVRNLIQSVYSSFLPEVNFLSCNPGNVYRAQCLINVNYQSLAGEELVLLQDKLLDPKTILHSMTSENVISSALQASSTSPSSTSISVDWDLLPSSAQTPQTSDLSGYIIFYKEITTDGYNKIAVLPSELTKILTNLQKFTPYKIVVCPYSKNGNGVPSSPLQTTTMEDVPTSPPLIKNITSPTSRSLRLTWTEIGSQSWHGVPSGYCVTYQSTSSNQSEIKVIPNVSQLSTMLTSVKPYTRYNVQVAAKTRAGCGVQDATSYITLEDAPSGPPQNVSAKSTGTESVGILVKWDNVIAEERNGIILGYTVTYWKDLIKRTVRVNDSDAREVEIIRLQYLTNYKVEVSAYTSVGDGPKSLVVNVTTDETTPAAGPKIYEAYNKSSTQILLKWRPIPSFLHRGVLLGYRIFYRPSNTKRKEKIIEIPDPHLLEYRLTDLFWWCWYEIRIAGYTRIGTGVTSNVTVQTDEEIPSRYPENIRGNALTTTSMLFEWEPILRGFAHGVILRYQLIVRETDSLPNIIVNTTLPAYETSYYMEGLKKFTNYTMWVSAFNSKGQGPVYEPGHITSTGEDGPEVPPDNIRVSTLEHISEIKLEWERIPVEFHNGILRGYYIEYTATVSAGKVVAREKRVVHSKRIRGNRYSAIIKHLDPGSTYEFRVFGYTTKNGTKSNFTVGETCRCPKYIRSNWWVLPPYTNTSNPESPGGIFFMVAKQVLDEMCGNCVNGHGETEFCYEDDCDKKRRRRSTGNSYQKNSLQGVATNIDENVEVSFPVQGNRFMTTYAGVFPYISVVDAPGSAYFTVKNVPSTAEVVVNASIACLPMVLLMTMFAWMAGIVIWVLERKHNTEHFPDPFTKGVPEGFWWAYISMTTVGYGDRSPVTIPGRIFAIIWVLMGLVIISIVTGGIVTSISSVLVIQEDKLYGAQVGAIENSAEYSKAVRQNADVVGFKNMEEIINAMHKKEISGALLDMYAAATKKDSFDGGDIQLNRLIEYPTGYGFVLSGDMAKAAPLFRDALDSQKNKISEIVEGNTESIQLDRNEAEEAKERSSGLFDPASEAFTKSFNVTTSLLVTAVVAALIWHFGRYRRKMMKEKKQLEKLSYI